MWKSYGIMGGWLAATIIISIMWYMNHWLGMVENPSGKIWVDNGFAVSPSLMFCRTMLSPPTSFLQLGHRAKFLTELMTSLIIVKENAAGS